MMGYNESDLGKLIYNFSSNTLTEAQISILSEVPNFPIPLKKVRYEEYLLPFELLFRSLKTSCVSSDLDLNYTKTKLKETVVSSYRFYNKTNHSYITKTEHDAPLELMLLEDVIIQKAVKGNVIILVDKANYVNKMNSIFENKNQFIKLSIDDTVIVKELIETEDRIRKVLDPLKIKGFFKYRTFQCLIAQWPPEVFLEKSKKKSVLEFIPSVSSLMAF